MWLLAFYMLSVISWSRDQTVFRYWNIYVNEYLLLAHKDLLLTKVSCKSAQKCWIYLHFSSFLTFFMIVRVSHVTLVTWSWPPKIFSHTLRHTRKDVWPPAKEILWISFSVLESKAPPIKLIYISLYLYIYLYIYLSSDIGPKITSPPISKLQPQ